MANPLYDALFAPHPGSDQQFLSIPDGSDGISYEAFVELSAMLAHALSDLGLAPGERLVAQVEKSPMALGLYAACVMAGVVYLPLNTGYTAEEVRYFLGDSGARVLICDSGKAAGLAPVATELGAQLLTMNSDGSGMLRDLSRHKPRSFAPVDRDPTDLAALLYTSGTTGRSKGAMLSHANLLSNAQVLAREWRFTGDDVLLHALPIFHTHGLFVATNICLLTGGAMILLPKFDADAVIAALPHATAMMGVPTFYTRLLDDPRFNRELVAHMRLFTSGSAPLLTETHEAFEARTGHRILERYGMTETNMNTSNPYAGPRKAGTVGKPLPGVELKITDPETGATLPDGEIGVIEVRGPNVFQGYWQMPEKTAEELRADGFFITGDLGRIDEDGYVVIVGRAKDLIISGGYNIYPKEVELVLDEMPGVLESAVIGVPHPDFGEGVVGVLVARDGAALDEATILAAAGARLAKFKLPKRLVVVKALPRNAMGKVQKNVLRQGYGGSFK
ncbi:MAG: malonyl-CoA synthase [Paracoccaceae bacterium]